MGEEGKKRELRPDGDWRRGLGLVQQGPPSSECAMYAQEVFGEWMDFTSRSQEDGEAISAGGTQVKAVKRMLG